MIRGGASSGISGLIGRGGGVMMVMETPFLLGSRV